MQPVRKLRLVLHHVARVKQAQQMFIHDGGLATVSKTIIQQYILMMIRLVLYCQGLSRKPSPSSTSHNAPHGGVTQ
jgi:hypothetical protein